MEVLQYLLRFRERNLPITGEVDFFTEKEIRDFQAANNLTVDGVVGRLTRSRLYAENYRYGMNATDKFLNPGEFFPEYQDKDAIFLHHTAGGPSPYGTIEWWNHPQSTRGVGTAFVIGGRTLFDGREFDGKILRAFPEYYWAFHLGLKREFNPDRYQDKRSIGIELCSYGPLRLLEDGKFYAVFDHGSRVDMKLVPPDQVVDLGFEWRGSRFYQRYTEAQIESCRQLMLHLAFFFNIPIEDRVYDRGWFDRSQDALEGVPGILTHVHVRDDKSDCFPQPEFIQMLNTLYRDFQNFRPNPQFLEQGIIEKSAMPSMSEEDVMFYTNDLTGMDEE